MNSKAMLDQVAAAVTDEWRPARQVHAVVGMWALPTIQTALSKLWADGHIRMMTDEDGRRLYRRAPHPQRNDEGPVSQPSLTLPDQKEAVRLDQ